MIEKEDALAHPISIWWTRDIPYERMHLQVRVQVDEMEDITTKTCIRFHLRRTVESNVGVTQTVRKSVYYLPVSVTFGTLENLKGKTGIRSHHGSADETDRRRSLFIVSTSLFHLDITSYFMAFLL